MYTASLLQKTVDTIKNRVTYHVEFTDGQQTFQTPFEVALYTPVDQVKKLVNERIAEYEAADVIQPQITPGPIDLSAVIPGAPELALLQARKDWVNKRARRNFLRTLVSEGFLSGAKLTGVQAEIDVLTAELQTLTTADILS